MNPNLAQSLAKLAVRSSEAEQHSIKNTNACVVKRTMTLNWSEHHLLVYVNVGMYNPLICPSLINECAPELTSVIFIVLRIPVGLKNHIACEELSHNDCVGGVVE
jgi:hypothetical protein